METRGRANNYKRPIYQYRFQYEAGMNWGAVYTCTYVQVWIKECDGMSAEMRVVVPDLELPRRDYLPDGFVRWRAVCEHSDAGIFHKVESADNTLTFLRR